MASIIDGLRSLGRNLVSRVSEGAARAAASFAERYRRHNSLIYEQRAHMPRAQRELLSRRHLTGERAFAAMMRGAGGIGWPASWSEDRSRQVLYFRRWIFVGADRICSTIAGLPPLVARVRPKRHNRGETRLKSKRPHGRSSARHRKLKAYYEARYRKSLNALKPHEEVEPADADHPLVRLLKKPNAWDLSAGQLWYELCLFLILTGNAYLWVVPDRAFGKPLELWVIPSQWVMGPKLGPAGAKYYQIMPYLGGAGNFTIPAEEIIHFHFKNPINKIDGWAPIQAISPWIDVSESIDDSRYWAFKQGTQAQGALEFGAKYDPDSIDIDEIGAKFLSRYQGERNAGEPLVLPPDVKFNPITIAPKDMNFTEGFTQLRDSILAALGVPKGIAGITDPGSDRALWGERAVFYEQAIIPRLRYIGEVLTAALACRWDDELRVYWEDPTPPDPQQVNSDLNLDMQHGLRSPNEARSLRGLEPIDDPLMDEPWLPPNIQPLSVIKASFKQQQQAAQQAQQQQAMPQQPEPAQSMQQQQQGKWPDLFGQDQAQDAALDVNDQAWDNPAAAVQKAHEYNERFQKSKIPYRLKNIGGDWQAVCIVAKSSPRREGLRQVYPKKEKGCGRVVSSRQSSVSKAYGDKAKYTVAVDLDGTLAEYDGWKGEDHFGALRPGAVESLLALRDRGCRIIIFTTRGNKSKIRRWLEENNVPFDHINQNPEQPAGTSGKVIADLYIDDRAIDARVEWRRILREAMARMESDKEGVAAAVPQRSFHNGYLSGKNGRYEANGNAALLESPRVRQLERDAVAAMLAGFPDVRQPNRYSCGASASCAVGRWFGVGPHDVSDWEKALGTTVERSTHPYAICEYLSQLGLKIEQRQNMTLDDLHDYTSRGWPVIVCVQDYGPEVPERAEFPYGHYLTVLGYEHGVVIAQDSAIENADHEPGGDVPKSEAEASGSIAAPGRILIDGETFLEAWHDRDVCGNPFIRYGIAVGPKAGGSDREAIIQKAWEASKHPRGGKAENRGWFSKKPGNGGQAVKTTPSEPPTRFPSFPGAPGAMTKDEPAKPDEPLATRSTGHDFRPLPADYSSASAPSSAADQSDLLNALETSRMKRADDLSSGINRSLLLTLEDGTQGVFKPESGERRSPVVSWRREVAAYRVAQLLGLDDLVPATTVREQPGEGIGSMQVYVGGALVAANEKVIEPFDGHDDAARAAVFDYLMGNVDRHFGNWLLKDDRLVLIDNGAALPKEKQPHFVPQPMFWARAIQADLRLPNLSAWRNKWDGVEDVLRDCGIEDKAIDLAKHRFDALVGNKSGRFADLPWMGFEAEGSVGSRIRKMYPGST